MQTQIIVKQDQIKTVSNEYNIYTHSLAGCTAILLKHNDKYTVAHFSPLSPVKDQVFDFININFEAINDFIIVTSNNKFDDLLMKLFKSRITKIIEYKPLSIDEILTSDPHDIVNYVGYENDKFIEYGLLITNKT